MTRDPGLLTTAEEWVAGYERAWRTVGTETLGSLFTEDASYRPAPFAEPIDGLAEIRVMWEAERSGADEELTMTTEVVAASDARAVVRVEVFYGPPTHLHYRDLWVLHLTNDGRCDVFEEWPYWPPGSAGAVAGGAR